MRHSPKAPCDIAEGTPCCRFDCQALPFAFWSFWSRVCAFVDQEEFVDNLRKGGSEKSFKPLLWLQTKASAVWSSEDGRPSPRQGHS